MRQISQVLSSLRVMRRPGIPPNTPLRLDAEDLTVNRIVADGKELTGRLLIAAPSSSFALISLSIYKNINLPRAGPQRSGLGAAGRARAPRPLPRRVHGRDRRHHPARGPAHDACAAGDRKQPTRTAQDSRGKKNRAPARFFAESLLSLRSPGNGVALRPAASTGTPRIVRRRASRRFTCFLEIRG